MNRFHFTWCYLNRNKAINKTASCRSSLWKITGIAREQILMVNSSDTWNESSAGNAYLFLLRIGKKLRSLVYSRCLTFRWLKSTFLSSQFHSSCNPFCGNMCMYLRIKYVIYVVVSLCTALWHTLCIIIIFCLM